MTEFEERISRARLRLRRQSVFFATLLLHADVVESERVEVAATDGERIYLNPRAALALPPAELDTLLLHQVLHAALSHVQRRGPRERGRWNRAADTVVRGILKQSGLVDGECSDLEALSAEEVCRTLPAQEGAGDADLLEGGAAKRGAQKWRRALAQARAAGGEAGEHRDMTQRSASADWRAALWRFLGRAPVDFGGFDRRFVGRGLYLEALDEVRLRAAVAVDTSGSVDEEAVSALLGEVRAIAGAYPHVELSLYYADSDLYGPYPLRAADPLPPLRGGGGTDFRPFFERVTECDVMIYLTDGYGDFPSEMPQGAVLWAVAKGGLEDAGFPFGEVLRLERA